MNQQLRGYKIYSMDDKKLLECLHQNQIKRLEGKIELLEEKVRSLSINLATYCADYERKIAELKGWRIHSDLEYYKQVSNYLNEQNRALVEGKENLSKFIKGSIKILESEQSKYKDFLDSSKNSLQHPPFLLEATQALDYLNILNTKLTDSDNSQINKDLEQKLKALNDENSNSKGIRKLISPRYKVDLLLKKLHNLINGRGCKEHVPYILILLEEKAIQKVPSWTQMREEFKDIGAKSNSNYRKFINLGLNANCYDKEEIESKRSTIKEILETCLNSFYSDFPF